MHTFARWLHTFTRWLIGIALLSLSACTTQPVRFVLEPEAVECLELYSNLDRAVRAARVADAGVPRIDGFPFLRTSRFLASFRGELSEQDRYLAWLIESNRRAIKALDVERRRLGVGYPMGELQRCGIVLVERLASREELKSRVLAAARVPSNYRYWQRIPGLYPLVAVPFRLGVLADQAEFREVEEKYRRQLPPGEFRFYGISGAGKMDIPDLLANAGVDALGIPHLSARTVHRLLAGFAPVVAVPAGSDNDRLVRFTGSDGPAYSTDNPVFYAWLDHGRHRGRVTIRLNYSFWFPRRPKEGSLDLLGGELDGLIWRVHFTEEGRVLAWDAVHQCGCWYRLFPASGMAVEQARSFYVEPIAVGGQLSNTPRKVLYLQGGTHHIQSIRDGPVDSPLQRIDLVPYDRLKWLPDGRGGFAGLFADNGIIPVSRRLERFLFWPMGVPSPGAMRVAGTHAIAFIGTRHFDEPFLLEEAGLIREDTKQQKGDLP